ncbi:MAG: Na+/H+ antiporter NhaC [Peptococcaceae bacterium]|nr:Na+/H+ antiporter NhaC [Peptococcaceae bacterium]
MRDQISFADSVIIMLAVIALIVFCVRLGLSLVIPLFLCWLIIFLYVKIRRLDWPKVESYAVAAIKDGFQSVLIVMAVGALIGAWILSGTVPTLIYYGLKMISPRIFLPATLILCSILSLATGTSYGSAGSAGLAMMGIGISMGFPPGMIAGAVICGALFGDKMSPFSDTTNLCPAMAGGSLFKHISMMCWNTIPAWLICLVIFYFLGLRYSGANFDPSIVREYMGGLDANFNINLLALSPIILIIVLLVFKLPALPTILIGAVFGGLIAMVNEGSAVIEVVGVMHKGFKIDSGILLVDKLLNRGGIVSMTDVILIMIFGMGLGGMLEKMGILSNFVNLLIKKISSVGRLVLISSIVGYISGAVGCTMSMSQVITGKLMAPIYREKGVAPEVLSRAMEDTGTLGGSLMPWHTNAVFFSGTLGVAYSQFLPFLFLSFLAPVISLIYAYTDFKIKYVDPETGEEIPRERAPIYQEKIQIKG